MYIVVCVGRRVKLHKHANSLNHIFVQFVIGFCFHFSFFLLFFFVLFLIWYLLSICLYTIFFCYSFIFLHLKCSFRSTVIALERISAIDAYFCFVFFSFLSIKTAFCVLNYMKYFTDDSKIINKIEMNQMLNATLITHYCMNGWSMNGSAHLIFKPECISNAMKVKPTIKFIHSFSCNELFQFVY